MKELGQDGGKEMGGNVLCTPQSAYKILQKKNLGGGGEFPNWLSYPHLHAGDSLRAPNRFMEKGLSHKEQKDPQGEEWGFWHPFVNFKKDKPCQNPSLKRNENYDYPSKHEKIWASVGGGDLRGRYQPVEASEDTLKELGGLGQREIQIPRKSQASLKYLPKTNLHAETLHLRF